MVNIYNCGQGDCFEIVSICTDKSLFIDLGESTFKLPSRNDIDVLITHSHDDHLLGNMSNIKNLSKIYVPAYYPEFLKIHAKLEGRLLNYSKIKFELLYEGKKIGPCNNIEILNPPLDPLLLFNLEEVALPSDDSINTYLKKFRTSLHELGSIIESDNYLLYERPIGYEPIIFMKALIAKYMKSTNKQDVVHNMCIVFKMSCVHTYLFTGDATRYVFNRLIKSKKDISCEILKVPHHGSIYNMSKKILDKINPDISIISHNNGYDRGVNGGHPHTTLLNLLKSKNVPFYVTNDIIKRGVFIKNKHIGRVHGYYDVDFKQV